MIKVTVTSLDEETGKTESWETQVDPADSWFVDRMEQSGNNPLLAGAITAIHTYDIFPPRQD